MMKRISCTGVGSKTEYSEEWGAKEASRSPRCASARPGCQDSDSRKPGPVS